MHHVRKARGNLDLTKFLIKIQIIIICSLRRCEHVHTVWLPLYPDSGAIWNHPPISFEADYDPLRVYYDLI